jgi:hypothetical protein
MPKKASIKNRIVGHGEKPAAEFNFNPLNWRRHPESQKAALREVLSKIGWVTGVVENVRTGNLIDGHARIEDALDHGTKTLVPFIRVDLSEDEERQILLLLDPIGSMATSDETLLKDLMNIVGLESDTLIVALSGFTEIDVDALGSADPNLADPNFNYQSQFGVIVSCKNEKHQKEVFDTLSTAGYDVKVVVV